jgi:iron complex outermembrane receptor protein
VNRFGEFCSFTLNPSDDQTFGAKWLTDVEVAFREQHITLAVGAQNIFNVLPDRNITQNSFSGIQTFPSQSPFGMNGRFLYGRITYRF